MKTSFPWNSAPRLLLLLLAAGGSASPEDARAHYERGDAFYRQGRYGQALAEFEAAYALRPLPRLLLYIGQAHRRLGHATEALAHCERYLASEPAPGARIQAIAETCIQQARALIAEAGRLAALRAESERLAAQRAAWERLAAQRAVAAPASARSRPPPRPVTAPVVPPLHRRPWLWGTVGAVLAIGVATTVVVSLRPWARPEFEVQRGTWLEPLAVRW